MALLLGCQVEVSRLRPLARVPALLAFITPHLPGEGYLSIQLACEDDLAGSVASSALLSRHDLGSCSNTPAAEDNLDSVVGVSPGPSTKVKPAGGKPIS